MEVNTMIKLYVLLALVAIIAIIHIPEDGWDY